MKKSTLLKLGFLVGMFAGATAQSQVFNMHIIDHGFTAYTGGGYNLMFYGNGAYSDPGNNVWNGFGNPDGPGSTDSYGGSRTDDGLQPGNPGNPYVRSNNGYWAPATGHSTAPVKFAPSNFGNTNAANAYADGSLSTIVAPIWRRAGDTGGNLSGDPATYRQTPAYIFSAATLVNAGNPVLGTSNAPLGDLVLSNVPPGTYNLFLYGANGLNNDRGAYFYASNSVGLVGAPLNGISGCTNDHIGPYATAFNLGVNFVVLTNVSPGPDTTITIYWGAVSNYVANGNPAYTNVGEGDFCGLQLAPAVSVFWAQQPSSILCNQGDNVALKVVAGGSSLTYQWYIGNPPGTSLSGKTSPTLALNNVQAAQGSNYFAVVTSGATSLTSSVASVSVFTKPFITSQFLTNGLQLYTGQNGFSLQVTAAGVQPVYCFWQTNGVTAAITTNSGPGVFTTESFKVANTVVPSSTYSCIVSNSLGTTTSLPVVVSTIAAPASAYATAVLAANPVAFWDLSETSGNLAYDGVGGNNGYYVGSVLNNQAGPPYAGFGGGNLGYTFDGSSAYLDCEQLLAVTNIGQPNLPGYLNITNPMTISLWSLCVTPGHFSTVAGHSDASYRVDVENGNGHPHFNISSVGEPVGPRSVADSVWHQITGVFDGTNDFLYVDGVLVAHSTGNVTNAPAFAGSLLDFWIGGDPQYGTGRLFAGTIDDVAIYSHALTAAQIQSIYVSSVPPPIIIDEPLETLPNQTTNANENSTVTLSVTAITPPLHYQWYEYGTGDPALDTPWPFGGTNADLVLTNVTASEFASFGGIFYCAVSNNVGTVVSSLAQVSVVSGLPSIHPADDLPAVSVAYLGSTAALVVKNVYGTLPFSYQWKVGGTNVSDNAKYSGTTNKILLVANAQFSDETTYQLSVTNIASAGTPTLSAMGTLYVETRPTFNTNGSGWSVNGNGTFNGTNQLQLTTVASGGVSSAWFNSPLYVGAFIATFTYQDVNTNGADGTTFCIQNAPAGTSAIGDGGGGLGVRSILPSVEWEFNIYNGHVQGITYNTNGLTDEAAGIFPAGNTYFPTTPVNIYDGSPIAVTI